MTKKRKPAVIYHAWRDGENSIIYELRETDLDYDLALKSLDNEYEYFTSRRKAVKEIREYLKDRIAGLKLALRGMK